MVLAITLLENGLNFIKIIINKTGLKTQKTSKTNILLNRITLMEIGYPPSQKRGSGKQKNWLRYLGITQMRVQDGNT